MEIIVLKNTMDCSDSRQSKQLYPGLQLVKIDENFSCKELGHDALFWYLHTPLSVVEAAISVQCERDHGRNISSV